MQTSYCRGHEIVFIDNKWLYKDTREICDDSRPCKKCNKYPLLTGEDACLGHIDGVINACCGHGIDESYQIRKQ